MPSARSIHRRRQPPPPPRSPPLPPPHALRRRHQLFSHVSLSLPPHVDGGLDTLVSQTDRPTDCLTYPPPTPLLSSLNGHSKRPLCSLPPSFPSAMPKLPQKMSVTGSEENARERIRFVSMLSSCGRQSTMASFVNPSTNGNKYSLIQGSYGGTIPIETIYSSPETYLKII